MKRKLFSGLLIITLALGVTACSSNNSNTNPDEQEATNAQDTVQQDNSTESGNTAISENMTSIYQQLLGLNLVTMPESDIVSPKDYYIFESVKDKIEDGFVSKAMMNVKLQDVFVIKTSDIKSVEGALTEYLNSYEMKSFGDGYGGEDNIESVRNAKIGTINDYVYFIAAPNHKEIDAKLNELLK